MRITGKSEFDDREYMLGNMAPEVLVVYLDREL